MKTSKLTLEFEIHHEDNADVNEISAKIQKIVTGYFNNGDLILENELHKLIQN